MLVFQCQKTSNNNLMSCLVYDLFSVYLDSLIIDFIIYVKRLDSWIGTRVSVILTYLYIVGLGLEAV